MERATVTFRESANAAAAVGDSAGTVHTADSELSTSAGWWAVPKLHFMPTVPKPYPDSVKFVGPRTGTTTGEADVTTGAPTNDTTGPSSEKSTQFTDS